MSTELGVRLKAARANIGVTQAELAEMLGVSRSYVNDAESGRREPSFTMIVKWCKVCKVNITFFSSAMDPKC